MKLIGSLTSPYARKARVVLAEKKIEYDFELDSPWTPDNKVAQINPLGKIPVLVLDDDTVLFDSRVIVEYLDNVTPNNKLMPAPNRERTEVKRWEALGDGVCDAAALIFWSASARPSNKVPTGSLVRKTRSCAVLNSCPNNSVKTPGVLARTFLWPTSRRASRWATLPSVSPR